MRIHACPGQSFPHFVPVPLPKEDSWRSRYATPNRQATGNIIWEALEDLRSLGLVATPQAIADVTGLKPLTVDDHVNRLVDGVKRRRRVKGEFEIVDLFPEPRPVSLTILPGGMAKIEIVDVCLEEWPDERYALAGLLQRDACQLSNILTGQQLDLMVGQIWEAFKALRELGA